MFLDLSGLSYEQRRARRRRVVRSRTASLRRFTRRELERGRYLYPPVEGLERPRTRADCLGHQGPCPFVACRYHLYLEVTAIGSIKFNFPDLEPWELEHSCALDVADRGPSTLERVGELTNVTRERTRQVENRALRRLAMYPITNALKDSP